MYTKYWDNQADKIRLELKENYLIFSNSLKIDNEVNLKIDEKNINDLKSVITYLINENLIFEDDDYQNLFEFGRIPASSEKIKTKEILNLINIIGLQILKYALYKIDNKSIATNFVYNSYFVQNIVEDFKNDIIKKINNDFLNVNNDTSIIYFYTYWEKAFQSEAQKVYNEY